MRTEEGRTLIRREARVAESAMKKARPTRKIRDVVKEREIATVVAS